MNNPGIVDGNQKIVGRNLVLNLDAAQKRSYSGSGTTWTDLSGNNNNGTLISGPTFNSANGGSIVFDGTNRYISTPLNIDANPNTICAWCYPTAITSINGYGVVLTDNGAWDKGFEINSSLWQIHTGNNLVSTGVAASINTWSYACLSYTNTATKFYINGVLVWTGAAQVGAAGSNVEIGRANYFAGGGSRFFVGRIAKVEIYNIELSATQVLNNFNAIKSRFGYLPVSVITSGLQLYLSSVNTTSNPGTGTAWNDISGNNRNFNWVFTPTRGTDTGVPYFQTLSNRCVGPASNSFGITNTTGYTVFLIMKQLSLSQSAAFKFYSSNGTGGQSRAIFSHCTWENNDIYFDQGGCCNADTRTNAASGGLTAWNIIVFRSTIATRSIFKNATSLITNSTAAANINLTTTAVDLGSSDDYGGNSSTWNARIAGFLVYNRGLSDAEISQNIQTLRTEFNI